MQKSHEFAVGDRVDLAKPPQNVERGPYKITGLMPEGRDGHPQYRIKSENGAERVVTQEDIAGRRPSSAFNA